MATHRDPADIVGDFEEAMREAHRISAGSDGVEGQLAALNHYLGAFGRLAADLLLEAIEPDDA